VASKQKALIGAVLADLDDDAPRLVYTDWLQEQGDPRGELAVVHEQLYASWESQKDKRLRALEKAILARHGDALLGPALAKLYDVGLNWTIWRLGFLDAVSITFAKKKKTSPYDVLTAVLESPSSVFLRRLELAHVPAAQHAEVVKTLLAAKARPPLQDLGLADTLPDEVHDAFPRLAGRRHGEVIEKVAVSDGPIENVATYAKESAADYGARCATRVISNRIAKTDFGLPILEPGGRPNRAAIAHAVERVIAGELDIPYSEPRQRAAANHLVFWLEQIHEPVPKALRTVALGPKKRKS
jgi:uncharacterized protein (TIGR02996 family)